MPRCGMCGTGPVTQGRLAPPRHTCVGAGEVDGSAQAMEYFPAAGVAELMVKDSRGASSSGRDFSLVLHVGDIA